MNGLNVIAEWAASRSTGHAAGALAFSAIHAVSEVGLLSLHPRHAEPLVRDAVGHLVAGGHHHDDRRMAKVVAAAVRWMEASRRFPWSADPAGYLKDWETSSALRVLAAVLPDTGLMAEEVHGVLESGTGWLAFQAVRSDPALWSILSPDAADAISLDAAHYLAMAEFGSGLDPLLRLDALMMLASLNPKIRPLADVIRQETVPAGLQRAAGGSAGRSIPAAAVWP